jgi:tripartite-type tricarboxylate transporter receptor subunit TctC
VQISFSALIATALFTVLTPLSAFAQQAPLKIVVGFPPGGGADVFARAVADRLKDVLNRQVIVENRPGAGGMIAAQQFKTMANDPNTILMGSDHQFVMVPLTMKNPGYKAQDFIPLAELASFRLALTVNYASPSVDLRSHLSRAKADPTAANYGVPAPGSLPQFIGWSLGQASGVPLNVVPYRGGAPLNTDLLGNQIPASIDSLGNVLESHRAKKLRVLAISGTTRSVLAPDVPTFSESGFKDLDSSGWVAAYAPPGTSEANNQILIEALAKVMAMPELRDRLLSMGFEPKFSGPKELESRVQRETNQWQGIVARSGFQLQ